MAVGHTARGKLASASSADPTEFTEDDLDGQRDEESEVETGRNADARPPPAADAAHNEDVPPEVVSEDDEDLRLRRDPWLVRLFLYH